MNLKHNVKKAGARCGGLNDGGGLWRLLALPLLLAALFFSACPTETDDDEEDPFAPPAVGSLPDPIQEGGEGVTYLANDDAGKAAAEVLLLQALMVQTGLGSMEDEALDAAAAEGQVEEADTDSGNYEVSVTTEDGLEIKVSSSTKIDTNLSKEDQENEEYEPKAGDWAAYSVDASIEVTVTKNYPVTGSGLTLIKGSTLKQQASGFTKMTVKTATEIVAEMNQETKAVIGLAVLTTNNKAARISGSVTMTMKYSGAYPVASDTDFVSPTPTFAGSIAIYGGADGTTKLAELTAEEIEALYNSLPDDGDQYSDSARSLFTGSSL